MKKKLSAIIPFSAFMIVFSVNVSYASVNLLEFMYVVKTVDESMKTRHEKKTGSEETSAYKLTQTNLKIKKEDSSRDAKG
ncbi:MAG: hypothetical protein HGB36_03035 [Chlorobiaceae bacterium]|jgi:hypothetical protein|nr:hypothetical protein [Chlorobiaceae bacterium]